MPVLVEDAIVHSSSWCVVRACVVPTSREEISTVIVPETGIHVGGAAWVGHTGKKAQD